jgi:hypothetical protein
MLQEKKQKTKTYTYDTVIAVTVGAIAAHVVVFFAARSSMTEHPPMNRVNW